jgi:hypothetical protein
VLVVNGTRALALTCLAAVGTAVAVFLAASADQSATVIVLIGVLFGELLAVADLVPVAQTESARKETPS